MNIQKQGIVPLTLLRITIGWLFLHEGVHKLLTEGWTAILYLKNSTGPLKGFYNWIIENDTLLAIADYGISIALVVIGLGLILGLFERILAAAGILLLILFYLSYPPIGDSTSMRVEGSYLLVDKNLVLIMALSVIYSINTSLITGIDRLLRSKKIS